MILVIRNAWLHIKLPVLMILPAAVFVADLLAYGVNVSILYLAVLVAIGLTLPRAHLRNWALLLVMLTLLGYFLKYHQVMEDDLIGYAGFRLINRTLVSAMLLTLVPALSLLRRRWLFDDPIQSQLDLELRARDDFEGLMAWLVPMIVVVLAIPLLVIVAVVDLALPGRFNLPILYALFLMVAGMVEHRRLLWGTLGVVLILTFAGYLLGPPPSPQPEPWWRLIVANRFLAAGAMLGITLLLDRRITGQKIASVVPMHRR